MSDIVALTQENEQLKKTLAQNSQGVETLMAQLDAHKQLINENLNVGINIRTNLFLFQKQNQELNKHIQSLNKEIDALKVENEALKAKLAACPDVPAEAA